MLTDGVTDGCGIQGDLAGIEGCFAGLVPKPGLGVLAPGVAGDADGGLDQTIPVGSKSPGGLEGFGQTMLVPAVTLFVDGQGCVDGVIGGRDGFDGIEQGLLIGFDLGDQEIAGLACSKVFLTMHGIGREHDAAKAQVADHLLCCRNFVGLLVDFRMGKHDRRWRGKGGQGLGCSLVTQMIETAPKRLAVKRDRQPVAGLACRKQGFGMAPEHRLERIGLQ